MRDIGIGLIGAGWIGAAHTLGMRQIADAGRKDSAVGVRPRLVASSDAEAEKGRAFASNWQYARFYDDPFDVIADGEVEAVYVCTPTDSHADYVRAAAAAGKHIFCEKPLAFRADDAESLWDAVADAGVIHQVGLVLRYAPVYRVLSALIDEHDTGPLRTALFRDDQCIPVRGVHRSPWRADKRRAGGGTLIEHSIHDLDILRWFCGEVLSMRASVANFHGHTGIEDYAAVTMEFADGGDAHLMSLWHNMVGRPSNRRLEIFYQNAFYHAEGEALGSIEFQLGDGDLQRLPAGEIRTRALALSGLETNSPAAGIALFPYAAEDCAFLTSIVNDTPAFPGFEVAYAAHVLVDTAYRSARMEGKRVAVQDPMAGLDYPAGRA